jgi:xylose isomerase
MPQANHAPQMESAAYAGALGSLDANTGVTMLGWDTINSDQHLRNLSHTCIP